MTIYLVYNKKGKYVGFSRNMATYKIFTKQRKKKFKAIKVDETDFKEINGNKSELILINDFSNTKSGRQVAAFIWEIEAFDDYLKDFGRIASDKFTDLSEYKKYLKLTEQETEKIDKMINIFYEKLLLVELDQQDPEYTDYYNLGKLFKHIFKIK